MGKQEKLEQVFIGNSEMAKRMKSFDWDNSMLGPVADWSESLKVSVRLVLAAAHPAIIWWGKHLVMLYNDAYIDVAGIKHPYALGQPGNKMWPEIWDTVGPLLNKALEVSESWFEEKSIFYIQRKEFKEETFYTFSFSPIVEADGSINGVFCTCMEETNHVLQERRLKTISEISKIQPNVNIDDARHSVVDVLSKNTHDLPFVLLYITCNDELYFHSYNENSFSTPLDDIEEIKNGSVIKNDISQGINVIPVPAILKKLFKIPVHGVNPENAVIIPVIDNNLNKTRGYLLVGISPVLEFDERYKQFLDLLASQLNALVTQMRTLEFERLNSNKLQELDKAKSRLLSNVSHELQTPLTLILGPLEELLSNSDNLKADVKEHLEMMQRNCIRLLHQVNNLLSFSSLEAGHLEPNFKQTDLANLTQELASNFNIIMKQAGIKYDVIIKPISEPIFVDEEMWEKILFNLLTNAYKYTVNGSIKVELVEHEGSVELKVTDTGIGIPQSEIPKLFERFYRVEQNISRSNEGFGIGLSLVADLVKLHEGKINVSSNEGHGSSFSILIPKGQQHLPSYDSNDKQGKEVSEKQNDPKLYISQSYNDRSSDKLNNDEVNLNVSEDTSKPVVLIVDDERDMLNYLSRLLQSKYQVLKAANGQEALRLLGLYNPELILSDVMMPVMDGIVLLNRVRSSPEFANIPFIFISAGAGEEDKYIGLDLGADDYLVKPFSSKELLSRVRNTIENARIRNEWGNRERKLIAQREFTQVFLENILDGINDTFTYLNFDLDYIYINQKAIQHTGLGKVDFIGKHVLEVFPHLKKSVFYQKLQAATKSHESSSFEYYDTNFKLWLHVKIYPVKSGILIFATDITKEKLFKQAQGEVNERFKIMANAAPVLIWMSGANMNWEFFNDYWLEFIGDNTNGEYDNQGVYEDWLKNIHPEDQDLCDSTYRAAFNKREKFSLEYRLLNKDNEYRWLLAKGVPRFTGDDLFLGYVGACTDITEVKWAEAVLEQYNKELERNVSIRTGEVIAVNEKLHQLTSHLQDLREQERKLIARDIHDDLGQAMAAFKIEISVLRNMLSGSRSKFKDSWHEQLDSMEYALDASIKSMRHIVSKLRPTLSDELDLVQDLEKLIEDLRSRVLLPVNFQSNIDRLNISSDAAIEVYRIIQESLTNVIRHANATHVNVDVLKENSNFIFVVKDNGKGFDMTIPTQQHSLGLLGIKERAQHIGAELEIYSKVGSGTSIKLVVNSSDNK
jgi:PAS domain S-box-containing protein